MKRLNASALTLLVLLSASGAWGASLTNVDELPSGSFGANSQRNPALTLGPGDCGPTSTVNSFQYLQSRYGITGLVDADPNTTINRLSGAGYMNVQLSADRTSGGAAASDIVRGKERAINEYNTAHPNQTQLSVEGQVRPGTIAANQFPNMAFANAINNDLNTAGGLPGMQSDGPTIDFLHDQLAKGQDVEIGFLWFDAARGVYAGGHVITATGLFNADDTSNTGTLDFIDPWGSATMAASPIGTITGLHNGMLEFTFSGGSAGAGGDPDNFDNVATGDIAFILAESPVAPLPSSSWGGLVLLTGLGIVRIWRGSRQPAL